jgi:hypothetical protein
MIQSYATGPNASQIRMVDLATGALSTMDYSTGAQAFTNDPRRWRPAGMTDIEHTRALEALGR